MGLGGRSVRFVRTRPGRITQLVKSSEKIALGRDLEELERPEAAARKAATQAKPGEGKVGPDPGIRTGKDRPTEGWSLSRGTSGSGEPEVPHTQPVKSLGAPGRGGQPDLVRSRVIHR